MSGTHEHDGINHGDDNVGFGHVHPGVAVDTFDASVDHLAGTLASNNKMIWSAEQAAQYLFRANAGYGVGGNRVLPNSGDVNEIHFGFFSSRNDLANNGYVYESGGRYFGLSEYFNFRPFSDAQKEATREAIQYWDDVMAPDFVETHVNDADIAFGNYTNQPGTQAYARLSANVLTSNSHINSQIREIGGDVWTNGNAASNFQLDEGGYGMNTLVHEVGHAFGMLHPGDYNFTPGVALSYATHAEYYQDTRSYSVLSYWDPRSIGARDFDWHRMSIAYGATPMVHDILAVQTVYGAEMTTRTGDTTYGFNSNAGRDAFDFVKTPDPTMTIWDAGGIDTLDASGYGTNQIIDLTPGSLSSIGGITLDEIPTIEQVNAARAAAGMPPVNPTSYAANIAALHKNPSLGRLTDNVGIAYGATIENAVGGRGADLMIGNAADNVLTGNAGDDLMLGRDGNDKLFGGEGLDTLDGGGGDDRLDGGSGADVMTGGDGDDTYFVDDAADRVVEAAEGAAVAAFSVSSSPKGDTVVSSISYALVEGVENLTLAAGASRATGNASNNTLTGNAQNNVIDGGAGDDRLAGGDGIDRLIGGSGDDIFVAELNSTRVSTKKGAVSLDIVVDFDQNGDDLFDFSGIDADTTKDGHQTFTFVGQSSGKGAGQLSIDTYGSVHAAEQALGMEIDGQEDSSGTGHLTILFGDTNGDGTPDFMIALLGTKGVDLNDFTF